MIINSHKLVISRPRGVVTEMWMKDDISGVDRSRGEGHNFFLSCLGEDHNFFQGFLGEGHNFF